MRLPPLAGELGGAGCGCTEEPNRIEEQVGFVLGRGAAKQLDLQAVRLGCAKRMAVAERDPSTLASGLVEVALHCLGAHLDNVGG